MDITRRNFLKSATAALLQAAIVRGSYGSEESTSGTRVVESTSPHSATFDELQAAFASPPLASKPGGYWWWFNTLMNKAGITRDLTEFRAKGISEVLLVNSAAGLGGRDIPSGP